MSGEHRYQTATPTCLATRRGRVGAREGGGAPGGRDRLRRAVALAVLAVAVWTMLGLGIGTLIRSQVAAILVAVAVTFLVEPLLSIGLNALELDSVGRFLPSSASSAMTSPPTIYAELLPWWAGALVLFGYAALFAALGVLLTLRRDVS